MQQEQFEQQYLCHLNAQQRKAVLSVDGNILLLATPGSGKTTVLVTRLGYMICCRGIDPSRILTMTYTRAATQDMMLRFKTLFGEESARGVTFRTINSVSSKIISYYCKKYGKASFTLLENDAELNGLIRKIYKRYSDEYAEDSTVKDIRTKIAYIKNMMLSDEETSNTEWDIDHLAEIYRDYQKEMRDSKRMDFDDQMVYALSILQNRPDVLKYYQDQYLYICVDEAQDTSKIQHEIIKLLASGHGNLFMVGDEDQSIYGFRAAYPEALLQFERDHPGAAVLLMEENYRSSGTIVDAANQFIAKNRFRHKKSIKATREGGAPIHVVYCKNREAQFYALQEMAKTFDRQTAILFRNNDSALPLIDAFERENIPYNSKNYDDHFFSPRMILDLRDIISFAFESTSADLFLKIYYKFSVGISKADATAAVERSRRSKKPIFEELLSISDKRGFARDGLIDIARSYPLIQQDDAETAVRRVWNDMNFRRYAEQKKWDPGKYQILCMLAKNVPSPMALFDKLDSLQRIINNSVNRDDNHVILSTIHSSKGLEYDQVYLLDIIDGIIPAKTRESIQNEEEEKEYEEARRLYYVSMTRAKNDLYILRSSEPSSFTSEMMRYLPAQMNDDNDFIAMILQPQIGKRFADCEFGDGTIIAQCEKQFLVQFQNDKLCAFSLDEMLNRYKPATAARPMPAITIEASHSQLPPREPEMPWRYVKAEDVPDRIRIGRTIHHIYFGDGVVKSLENGVLTLTFEKVGEKRILFQAAIANKLLQWP